MRSLRLWISLAVLLSTSSLLPALAQDPSPAVPPIITAGLDAYRNVGIDQAFRAWLRNSPLHWDPAMAAPLHQAQDAFGTFESWEVIGVRGLSPRTRIVYLVLDYQSGPEFAKFVAYQAGEPGWIVTSMKFSMDEDAVLPPPPPL